jgi:putative signal transducing protein
MDGDTVTVAVATSRIEAELIVGVLHSHGVPAAIIADDAGGQQPQWQIEGVRVLVATADADLARAILAAGDEVDGG